MGKADWLISALKRSPTVKPGYRYGFKEDEVEEAHPTGRVVIEQLEDVQTSLEYLKTRL